MRKREPKADIKELQASIEKLLKQNPMLVLMGLTVLYQLMSGRGRPAHLKDMPPVHPRTAGAWRGKGSFGRGFGSHVKHR